jgi:ppGpp synthetase/RelA/SpoT-type nucleotidyltranferase
VDVISAFMSRYVKEYDFYDQVALLARERLDAGLKRSGVRCMVTSRAKDPARLEIKCRQRDIEKQYTSPDQIFNDIHDLAGVRVALYFPGERDQIGNIIGTLFHITEERKFPESSDANTQGERFSGYSAMHYRVRLKEDSLSESDKRYSIAKVEIQVASVLMHAWSEVEHDLKYKPLEGELSDDEYAILDQLNGMVIAGEIALETLQRAGNRRVAQSGRPFKNHYELAAHLLGRVDLQSDELVNESGLGRVDLLFELLRDLHIRTPADLSTYLDKLHGNLEERPLAEQVIDALLDASEVNYEVYLQILDHDDRRDDLDNRDTYRAVGKFLRRWATLENLVRNTVTETDPTMLSAPMVRLLEKISSVDHATQSEIRQMRQLRNRLVHTQDVPSAKALDAASQTLEKLTEEIRSRT